MPIIENIEKYMKPRFDFASSVYCEQFVGLVAQDYNHNLVITVGERTHIALRLSQTQMKKLPL